MLKLTKHAQKRLQQRGITLEQLIMVFIYGAYKNSRKCISYFTTKESERLMLSDGLSIDSVDKCKNIYVIANGSLIITICHKYKKKIN